MSSPSEPVLSAASQRVLIIDYGMGNLHSVAKALIHVAPEAEVVVSNDPALLKSAERIILPGVGAMRDCMAALRDGGWIEPLKAVWHEKPLLGICVGMQMLLESSEENGGTLGLGFFKGRAVHIGKAMLQGSGGTLEQVMPGKLKVPHMGWNQVAQVKAHPVWANIDDQARFYFVHSFGYQVSPLDAANDGEAVSGVVDYGARWGAVLAQANVVAVQFHPEKSQHAGLQLLKNFLSWQPKL